MLVVLALCIDDTEAWARRRRLRTGQVEEGKKKVDYNAGFLQYVQGALGSVFQKLWQDFTRNKPAEEEVDGGNLELNKEIESLMGEDKKEESLVRVDALKQQYDEQLPVHKKLRGELVEMRADYAKAKAAAKDHQNPEKDQAISDAHALKSTYEDMLPKYHQSKEKMDRLKADYVRAKKTLSKLDVKQI